MPDTALAEISAPLAELITCSEEISELKLSQVCELYDRIREDSLEMARLKSETDVACFTLGSQFGLPAHTFHFLMRQYSLATLELKRLLEDREVQRRRIVYLDGCQDNPEKDFYVDIEISRAQTAIDTLDISIRNKQAMCISFEKYRRLLIEKNTGVQFTDKDYQAEEPEYWRAYFGQMLTDYQRQISTGVPEGVWKSLHQLQPQSLLDFDIEPPIPKLSGDTAQLSVR